MNEIKFKSLNELYKRLLPALRSKKKILIKERINYVHEEDIWNYCKDTIWNKSHELALYNMVDDILNVENHLLDNYVKNLITDNHRRLTKEEEKDETGSMFV